MDERDLLHQFTASASHDAFAQLVRANIDLVYSAARRQISDPGLAEDVTQAVFIILAKKAGTIRGTVAGWLVRTTYLACKDARRMAARRDFHERRAMRSEVQTPTDPPPWEIFSPLIDEALAQLSDVDRDVITLRYLKNLSLREVAAAQKTTEEAARKRVDRAIVRLRALLATKSAPPDANALGALLLAQMIHPAPSALATTILAGGVAAAAAPALLAKSVMDLITWLKLKMALTIVMAAAFLTASAAIAWSLVQFSNQRSVPLTTGGPGGTSGAATRPISLEGLPILAILTNSPDRAIAADAMAHVASKVGAPYARATVDSDVRALSETGHFSATKAEVIPAENPDHTLRGVYINFHLDLAANTKTTAPALSNFQGWIHMVTDDGNGNREVRDWDAQSRAFADRTESNGRTEIYFKSPITRENSEYHAADGWLIMSYLAPEEEDSIRQSVAAPTFTEFLQIVRAGFDRDAVQVQKTAENGQTRYDLTLSDPAAQRNPWGPQAFFSITLPATLWVDPATNRITAILEGQKKSTFTYGGPALTTILEAGVPKDAKLWDCRPAPETMAVFNRMMGRMEQGLPDGVFADTTLFSAGQSPSMGVTLYEIAGKYWSSRGYGTSTSSPAPLALPEDWTGNGADEFFHQIAFIWPKSGFISDGETAWSKEFDPKTGDASFSWGEITPGQGMAMRQIPGGRKITGWDARFAVSNRGLMQFLYPDDAIDGVYFTGATLDLKTDPGRPGEVGLHVLSHGDSPDVLQGESIFWIDTAHADRPVRYEETYYRDPKVRDITSLNVTEFSDYFQLPDGRWLPGTSTQTQLIPVKREINKRTFHFFPDKTLPPLPPATEGKLP